jgi:hypothetical protein
VLFDTDLNTVNISSSLALPRTYDSIGIGGFGPQLTKLSFAAYDITSKNIHFHTFTVDKCTYRDASTVCRSCLPDYGLGNYVSGNICLGSGEGLNSTGAATACSDINCSDCRSDYRICVACKTGSAYYFLGNQCVTISQIPDRMGANPASQTVTSCQSPTCISCQNLYTICIACDPSSLTYLYNQACYLPVNLPTGIGAKLGTALGVSCDSSNCADCRQDKTYCLLCMSSYYLYGNDCYLPVNLPNGVGADTATGKALACASGCTVCKNDYTICEVCDPAYLIYQGKCYLVNNLPSRVGKNGSSQIALQCSDPNCDKCKLDYTQCTLCLQSYYSYLGACVLSSSLPNRVGADCQTGQTQPCSDARCLVCRSNYLQCTACDTGYLFQQKCYLPAELPSNYGLAISTLQVSACAQSYCDDCKLDTTVCVKCLTSQGFFKQSNTCTHFTSFSNGVGGDLVSGEVRSCSDANCKDCRMNYLNCAICLNSYYMYQFKCYTIDGLPDGVGATSVSGVAAVCFSQHSLDLPRYSKSSTSYISSILIMERD